VKADFRCRVCNSAGPFETYRAREMMFARGESFDYRLCSACGCLQIADIPADLSRYYGDGYYSFCERRGPSGLTGAMVRARNRHLSGRFDPLGAVISRLRPFEALASLRPLKLPRDARIVDVGCGGGELLLALQSAGFSQLLGVDPLLPGNLDLGAGLQLRRAELSSIDAAFDVVMFHHSLEHIADQRAALQSAHALLNGGGTCLVRIPTVSSYAWRHYGVDWSGLDAPRHLYLHSTESIRRLAAVCGFEVQGLMYDSTGFQCWGSEQYRRNIALMPEGTKAFAPAPGVFTARELRAFERRATQLNRERDGDQIVVYLRSGKK